MNQDNTKVRDANRDPLTGEPGAHPVGTGVGAVAGGVAAGAAIGTVAGPLGTAVGAAVGAVVGGLAGKGVAEAIDPTAENAYWEKNYRNRSYVTENDSYDSYRPAYETGYHGFGRHAGKRYDDVERELQSDYTARKGTLPWDKAKPAVRDAWDRVADNRKNQK
ncbi:MAG: hypothetical protein ABIQ35_08710 [Verrucomicrobiota bacterium]